MTISDLDYATIQRTLSEMGEVTPSNVLNLVTKTMVLVDNFKTLEGRDKKQLCKDIVVNFIESKNFRHKSFILDIVDTMFDSFVENIINISKSSFNKKTILDKLKNIFCACRCS